MGAYIKYLTHELLSNNMLQNEHFNSYFYF